MAEDGHAGVHGLDGCTAEGMMRQAYMVEKNGENMGVQGVQGITLGASGALARTILQSRMIREI